MICENTRHMINRLVLKIENWELIRKYHQKLVNKNSEENIEKLDILLPNERSYHTFIWYIFNAILS